MQPKPEEELSKCRHDNFQYKGCGACCPDCGAWLDEDEWHEWQIDQKDAHIATLTQQNAELEEECNNRLGDKLRLEQQLASLREAAQTVVDRMRGSGGINPDAADALLKLAALLRKGE